MKNIVSLKRSIVYVFLILLGIFMLYPLIWLFFATFKPNSAIFNTTKLFPDSFSLNAYVKGWQGSGQTGFGTFFINSFKLVIPVVVGAICSSTLVAYGFARFRFPCKKILFALMISTLMLPNAIIIIPRFILFNSLGWINTYLPFTVPSMLAGDAFLVFMMVQFIHGIPRELDESAYIDGYGTFGILVKVIVPLCKPAIFSVGIFSFIWSWNDFFNSVIYINSVRKYTVSLGLKMAIDIAETVNWSNVFAMSLLAIIPGILIFFFAQKYFVEGIATSGIKG